MSARRDKRAFIENLASEAEKAAAYGNLGTVYKITKRLCGKCTYQTTPVKDKNGNICTPEREQAARWVQHFQEVLNLPEPEQPANIITTDDTLEINTSAPDYDEVRTAILAQKSGKACGIDATHAEMLKADISTSTRVLTDLFQTIWNNDTIPEDWSKGLIAKIPKKSGVRQGCIISPILFLITIDWITTNTIANKPRGIQWTLFSQLEDLDFADDLAILSTNHSNIQAKTDRLINFVRQVGLSINISKTQVMYVNSTPTAPILVNGELLEFVEDSGAQKDIKAGLGKAQGAFSQLRSIWRSKQCTTAMSSLFCCMVQRAGEWSKQT
ncbi:hypothetical protein SKAU_G00024040 [Synaphobranchus kaupii]|uniref:Reverse transcriptase domain-containing protein n=1 Tax=Synaphobranchus kaupii TaxID=118154 RepID=A0A9Q1JCH4_SYNKA|nr:hypothetical protein SKAU_G00024040 [Synaphobranchus kaupii]